MFDDRPEWYQDFLANFKKNDDSTIRIKQLIDEDFVNYRKPSMFIGTISCGGKCYIEAGLTSDMCQNDELRRSPIHSIRIVDLIDRYLENDITQAIVFGGLEPFEQPYELERFIYILRECYYVNDDVVIYTGYNEGENSLAENMVCRFPNIIVKYGRFIPNRPHRFDEVLGVELASDNQFAKRIDYKSKMEELK